MSFNSRPRSDTQPMFNFAPPQNIPSMQQLPNQSHLTQQSIVPFLQTPVVTSLENIVKSEIQKYFNGVDVYLEQDIVARFGSYMTGIDVCVVYKEKLITIYLKYSDARTNIKDLSHFVFCSNRIKNVNPHFKLYMLLGSKTQPTQSSINLINDHGIHTVVSQDERTFLNNLMQLINSALIDTSSYMEVC
jgi:hypothetical protein